MLLFGLHMMTMRKYFKNVNYSQTEFMVSLYLQNVMESREREGKVRRKHLNFLCFGFSVPLNPSTICLRVELWFFFGAPCVKS